MPDFTYIAADTNGKVVNGSRFARDEGELAAVLKQSGLLLIEIKDSGVRSFVTSLATMQIGRIGRPILIDFCNSMGVMLHSGVSVLRALDDLRQDSDSKTFQKALAGLITSIEAGDALHEAMARQPRVFPQLFVRVVEIGESTGNLDAVFFDLVNHLKRIDTLIKNTRKAMIYPSFVLVAMLLACFVFLTMVFPPLLDMMKSFKVQLPLVTRVIIFVSETLRQQQTLIGAIIAAAIVLVIVTRRNPKTRYYYDWCEQNIPILKTFFIHLRMSFFMRYFAMLLGAGVNVLRGLELSAASVNNLVLQKVLNDCREQIIEGKSLSSTFRQHRIIPNMVARMIAVGEESGSIDEQMEYVANEYDEALNRRITIALALLEPIMIFMLAGVAIVLVMGVMLPLYDLVDTLSTRAAGG
ncbi:MAG: type II secretion system F family protein [Deltaproteobacteria bacterium]|nr:type II secretion system F family protein [Deltaproteobacteria bacterium]